MDILISSKLAYPVPMNIEEQQRQLVIILSIIFIGFLGTAMPYPILPPLFLHPEQAGMITSSMSYQFKSILLGLSLAIYPLGIFFGSPILGSLSDRIGRRKVISVTLFAASIGYLISGLAIWSHHLVLFIFSRFVTGLMEGNIALGRSMAIDLKLLSKQRSFGKITAVSSVAYIVGPLFGGFFSDPNINSGFSYQLPFFIAALMAVCAAIIAVLFLQPAGSRQHKLAHHPLKEFNIVRRLTTLHKQHHILLLLIISTLFTFAVDTLYEYGPIFLVVKWQMSPMGIAIFGFGLATALAVGGIIFPEYLSRRLGLVPAILTVSTLAIVGFLSFSITTSWQLTLIPYTLIGFIIATNTVNLTTLLSDNASELIQGEVMGTQLGLRMLGDAIISFLSTILLLIMPALPFIIGAGFILTSAYLLKKYYG